MNQIKRIEDKIIRALRSKEEKFFGQKIIKESPYASPDFMIIGAAKAGTTSLFQYLAQHPEVMTPRIKEIKYFSMNKAVKGLNHYLSYFPLKQEKENKLSFDATPTYLFLPKVPAQVARLYPNIKIIAILRDPAKRAFSQWNTRSNDSLIEHRSSMYDTRTFEEAVSEELSNRAQVPTAYQYIAKGEYAPQLKNWYQHFPKENILLLDFDDLKNNVKQLLKDITNFLEIPFVYADFEESNQKIDGVKFMKDTQNDQTIKAYNTTPYKTKISLEMHDLLRKYYHPFDEELRKITGRTFGWMKTAAFQSVNGK